MPDLDQHAPGDADQRPTVRAAEYVRMSTDHQKYSTENQADAIRHYASSRGIEIVKTYADDGKSGLSIDGRASLQRLIADVEAGAADFEMILVYDVSRWGRFQDVDESAYYEYILPFRPPPPSPFTLRSISISLPATRRPLTFPFLGNTLQT